MILRIALPTPLRRLFDYLPPDAVDPKTLAPGVRVRVPFQSRTLVGFLIEVVKETTVPFHKLKKATEIIDTLPILPQDIFQLCEWSSQYYHYALGEVLFSALPSALRKGKTLDVSLGLKSISSPPDILPTLNTAQAKIIEKVNEANHSFAVYLLEGVTGSGKTEVYLRCIEQLLQKGKQALVLVPEISLTPQTIQRFRARFNVPVATLHSQLTEKQRLQAWCAAHRGEAKIMIGTRSAIFTPFSNLGLIIVDEEHDTSFKQQERFRYHARDLAIMRARFNKISVILGSATPSLESLLNAKRQRYEYLSLPHRAGNAKPPAFHILNIERVRLQEGLSPRLLQLIQEHLDQNNQVLLFLNRRGFAPVLYCTACGWMASCKRCNKQMVYHRHPPRLHCHHCETQMTIPTACTACSSTTLQPIGVGTQRLEKILSEHFPAIPLIRVDRDSTKRKEAMQSLLEQVHKQEKAILLGTQMLAKGHHFPKVTLVGIVDADSGLFSADFRAAEQMGQLFLQVAGRAGRAEKPGTVVIQTRHPQHPLLQTLIRDGYRAFSHSLLQEREQAILPPYAYVALFRAEAYAEKKVLHFLSAIKDLCASTEISVWGPVPALLAKRKGLHCQHLLIKSVNRSILQQFLSDILQKIETLAQQHTVKWIVDVDPVEM